MSQTDTLNLSRMSGNTVLSNLNYNKFVFFLFDFTGAEFVIRAVKGETVHLPCLSHPYNSYLSSVEWTKNSQTANVICKQTVCENKASSGYCVSPFTVTAFNLNIENVQFNDFGSYTCKWSRIVPPPTLDVITNLTLLVEGNSLFYEILFYMVITLVKNIHYHQLTDVMLVLHKCCDVYKSPLLLSLIYTFVTSFNFKVTKH